jgi:hypothetical protein
MPGLKQAIVLAAFYVVNSVMPIDGVPKLNLRRIGAIGKIAILFDEEPFGPICGGSKTGH